MLKNYLLSVNAVLKALAVGALAYATVVPNSANALVIRYLQTLQGVRASCEGSLNLTGLTFLTDGVTNEGLINPTGTRPFAVGPSSPDADFYNFNLPKA